MIIVNYFFNFFWICQLRLMKTKAFFENIDYDIFAIIQRITKVTFALPFTVLLILILLCNYFHINQNNYIIIVYILSGISGVSIFLYYIDIIYQYFYCLFTTLRGYMCLSIIINFILSYIISQLLEINSDIYFFFIYVIIYIILSLISNSNIAITANTIIEILLALFSLTKIMIVYFFENTISSNSNFVTLNQASIDELHQAIATIENQWINYLDFSLFPLLIINGLALLFCNIHSYWIKEYNNKMEITRDNELIKKYIKHKN